MAYALNEKEREDEELAQEGQGQQLGAESAIVQDAPEPTEQTDKGSGQYVNLQSYLEANKPQQFGQQVAGKLGEAVVGAEGAQKEAESKFKGLSDQGAIKEAPNLIQEAVARPEDVLKDQQKRESFTKMRDARYQGPNQLAETEFYDPTQRATREASEQAEASKNEAGRRSLLDQYYGAGAGKYDYTRGQKKLDELLISGDQGAKAAFEQQQKKAGTLNPAFQNLQQQLGAYAQQRSGETQAVRNATRNALGISDTGEYLKKGPIEDVLTNIRTRKGQRDTEYRQSVPLIEQALRNRDISGLSQDLKNSLGIGDVSRLYRVDPYSQLSSVSQGVISDSSVTTPEEFNRIKALSELSGLNQGWIDPNQVGKYDTEGFYNYNADALRRQIADQERAYNQARSGTMVRIPSANASLVGGRGEAQIDEALAAYEPHYQQALQDYIAYGGGKLSGGQADFLKSRWIDPYEAWRQQATDLENAYGYNNLLKTMR